MFLRTRFAFGHILNTDRKNFTLVSVPPLSLLSNISSVNVCCFSYLLLWVQLYSLVSRPVFSICKRAKFERALLLSHTGSAVISVHSVVCSERVSTAQTAAASLFGCGDVSDVDQLLHARARSRLYLLLQFTSLTSPHLPLHWHFSFLNNKKTVLAFRERTIRRRSESWKTKNKWEFVCVVFFF